MVWAGLLILFFLLVIFKIKNQRKLNPELNSVSISIIIPFRNEIKNLENCLNSLLNEELKPGDEIIFINDHSEDNGADYLRAKYGQLILLELNSGETGKKSALAKGINYAKNEWIITLDADCRIHDGYLNAMKMAMNEDTDMILARVFPDYGTDFPIKIIEQFESVLLSSMGYFSSLLNLPLLATGAALGFRKSMWNKVNRYNSHANIKSGDDVYLLRDFFMNKASITFINHKNAVVLTQAANKFSAWIDQKARWANKQGIYPDLKRKALGIYFLIQLFLPSIVILFTIKLALVLILLELIIVFGLLKLPIQKIKILLLYWFPLRIIYPFLVILILFKSRKTLSWKGRPI